MKKGILFFISLITLLLLTGCGEVPIEKVDVYEVFDFETPGGTPDKTFTNPEEVKLFYKAFHKAKQLPGMVNVIEPNYYVELGDESYYLWKDSSMLMKRSNTNTVYELKESESIKIHELLVRKKKVKMKGHD